MIKFKVITPFSDDVFADIYPQWLFWNAEKCISCHMEDINTIIFETTPLSPQQNKEYSLYGITIGCFLFVHRSFGVLYCTCTFSKSSLVISEPKIAYPNKERCVFRLEDVSDIIEEDTPVVNISCRGCLLNYEAEVGSIKIFHLNMKRRLEVIAFCVHVTNVDILPRLKSGDSCR